jgi:glycosyltransferase involved in cell wall biosynthesis/GT2 family glycosyltransferase
MKIIFLAPGLARVKRGMERFFLELSGELRKSGLDATCWGTSEGPGVEAIPIPSRIELEQFAKDHLQRVPDLPPAPANALQAWALYTEDQLFAIPAVLLVHTDYFYAPIDAMLWNAGACFHTLGPWLTAPLRQQGVSPDAIVELPMCIDGGPYRGTRSHRDSARAELGIPPDAFVVLSVGMFDLAAKRHDYVLAEIQKLAHQNIWWIVAGSRGSAPSAWEDEARRALGSRFVALTDVPFDRMPRIYTAADLFVSASLYETFGLVYLEAQLAGLPAVAHDTPITRHLFAQLPDKFKAASLVDMRRPGAAAATISRWAGMLANASERDSTRAALDAFAQAQERQYSWSFTAPKFAAAFQRMLQSSGAIARGGHLAAAPPDEQLHRHGIQFFVEGKLNDALAFIARSIGARETAERWNDWATIQSALHNPQDAEQGFRRALTLAPNHAQAATNLGAVLAVAGRFEEAIPFLEKGIAGVDQNQRAAFAQLLEASRAKLSAAPPLNENEIVAFLHAQEASDFLNKRKNHVILSEAKDPSGLSACRGDRLSADAAGNAPHKSAERIAYCSALLKQIPAALPGQRLLGIGTHGNLLVPALKRFHSFDEVTWGALGSSLDGKQKSKNDVILSPPRRAKDLSCFSSDTPASPDHTDIETSSIDVVVLSQIFESIADDPMRLIAEVNRVLKPGGTLVLTAANIASARSLHTLLRGGTPYVDGRFSPSGETAHHREYTSSELETLAHAGGFGQIQIVTRDILWKPLDALLPSLVASGFSVAARGDTILLTARKESTVRDRFPTKLYDLSDVQSGMSAADKNVPLRILVIFETLPLPEGGGADHRLLQVIRLLREQGHAVTFLAPRTSGNGMRSSVLKEMGVEVRLEDSEVLRLEGIDIVGKWTLQEVLREGQFDLAMIGLWFWMGVNLVEHYLDEIRRLSPLTRIAILSDDYHGLREQGGAEISGLWSDRERAVDFTERELEAYRRSDLVISISDSDKKKIGREIGKVPIEVLPMMIETQPKDLQPVPTHDLPLKKNDAVILSEAKDPSFLSADNSAPGFDQREGIVYLGHFNNPPTLDGLEWYIREVAPLVREKLPQLKLYVVGAQLPDTWSTPDPNVIRVGFRPDLAAEFAKYRILISPVRFGTGIKTKNLHAIAHGLPIVTNTKGADGANLFSGETALIADDPKDFAAAVIKLYTDGALWEKLSQNIRAHAQKYFSREAMDAALRGILDRARSLKPKPYDPAHVWSMRLVEKMFLEVSTYQPARDRHSIRVLAYSRAAEDLLAQGNRAEARRQLRHVFNYFSHTVSRSIFFGSLAAVVESMERTYRALGETEGAEEFRREARQFSATVFPELPATPARSAELATPPTAAIRADTNLQPARGEDLSSRGAAEGRSEGSAVSPSADATVVPDSDHLHQGTAFYPDKGRAAVPSNAPDTGALAPEGEATESSTTSPSDSNPAPSARHKTSPARERCVSDTEETEPRRGGTEGETNDATPVTASGRERHATNRNGRENLDLSVVLPTFNRVDVLSDCLGALNRQTLSPHRFEVIVVDDGTTDGTRELCSKHKPRHEFHFFTQQNGGAGAARRLGVEHARGKYLLFINDDTIAARDLLERHLELQRAHADEKIAVLGHFYYPEAAKKRALTWFLSSQPFLFPQVGLKAGVYTNHSFFITCNICVRRDLVLAAGSFDPLFRVGEDTELGVRLMRKGLKVVYSPQLEAMHDHLDFKLSDLMRRAETYGKVLVNLFQKHPDLLADGKGVLGTLDAASLNEIDSFIAEHEAEIPAAMESLAKFDYVDFLPFFSNQLDGKNAAEVVMDLFSRSIPIVYWYHLFLSFLAARNSSPTQAPSSDALAAQSADA